MIINFQLEAAKRRDRPGKTYAPRVAHDANQTRIAARSDLPVTEFGSGWYHFEAVKTSSTIQSHRD